MEKFYVGSSSYNDDKEKIIRFLFEVRRFLSLVLETGEDSKGKFLFIKELHSSLRETWVVVEPYFDVAIGNSRNVTKDRLVQHGLVGIQLDMKIEIFNFMKRKYKSVGGKSILRRLFDAIDTLLESILAAIGVGGAISEFKDSVKNSIDD